MTTGVFVMVSILVGAFALGYYMDWFGLWVSKKETQEQIDLSKARMQKVGEESKAQDPGGMPAATPPTERRLLPPGGEGVKNVNWVPALGQTPVGSEAVAGRAKT
jgi:hypothetical protein